MPRLLAALGLTVAAVGLGAQFTVSIPAYLALGRSLPGAIVAILSFFTILTNIAAGLVYLAALTGIPTFFARQRVRNGLLPAIVVVGLVYHFVLAPLLSLQGLHLFADTLLHYVAPPLYLAWWLTGGRNGSARFHDLPYWLIYPFAYLIYALARGRVVGEYPYPFLDLTTKTASEVAFSVAFIVALFAVLAALTVTADRLLPLPRRD